MGKYRRDALMWGNMRDALMWGNMRDALMWGNMWGCFDVGK